MAGMSVNGVLNTYTYSYGNTTRAKLDTDNNAAWTEDELRSYADAYKSATGKELDVDALMEKYAKTLTYEDGTTVYGIDVKSQEQMMKDDALGFSVLKSAAASSSSTSSSTSKNPISTSDNGPSSMTVYDRKYAAMDAVESFTYAYNGKLQPLLDKNADGVWSREEIGNYADAFSKATGQTLNVDEIFEKYANEDGVIDPLGQEKMKKDDALHLDDLLDVYFDAVTIEEPTYNDAKSTLSEKDSSANSLQDLLGAMSPAGKASYSLAINKYTMQGNLLSMMTGSLGMSANTGSSNILNMQGMFDSLNSLQSAKLAYGTKTSSYDYDEMMSANSLNNLV